MIGSSARHRLRAGCAASALGVALLAAPAAAGAQDATPMATPSALPSNCAVIASNLYNPRGLTIGTDGTLYIAESGDGGQTADYGTPAAGTPVSSEPVTTHGTTGRVTVVTPDGTQKVLVDGLTSYVFGTEVVGPAGVAVANGKVYVSIGGPGPATAAFPPAGNADSVVSVDPTSGAVTAIANIGAYERANNLDPNAIDSNVSGIAIGVDGRIYVADAGGNDIYTIDPATGDLSLLAVIPGLPSVGSAANPGRGGKAEVDPVPTSLVVAPDRGVYVGLLTGAALWGAPGSAKVIHVAADGTMTDAATGLNLVVGVALGPDGSLYASEFSSNFFATPPAPGSVMRVTAGGSPEPVLTNLPFPYAIAVGADGSLYIAIHADAQPASPPNGEVLKCDVGGGTSATPASTSGPPAVQAATAGSLAVSASAASLDYVAVSRFSRMR